MPTIQQLLQRWGFVKLRSYGLELTADGRILSTRPAVLDDGTGGPIVGWQDGDVSIWKLSRWSGGSRVGSEVASGVIQAPAAPAPAARPAIPASSEASAAPSRPSAPVIPAGVAGEPPVDEDDWEWTIALARARVAVEEAEVARPPAVAPRPERPAVPPAERPTLRSSATADLAASGDWREADTVTAEASAYEDYRVSSFPLPRIVAEAALPRATTPSTVIPVPALPTVDATRRSRMEPVVRSAPSPTLVNRFAKGTGPVDPPVVAPVRPAMRPAVRPAAIPLTRPAAMPLTRSAAMPLTRSAAMIIEDTHPSFPVGEHTTPGVAPATRRTTAVPAAEHDECLGEPVAPPAPSSGDRTQPGIALPAAARVVTLPSIKRAAR
ncbi:MAG TPA: hypothetical protein VHT91_00885 [Kofleriaceae bacterium]|jgi:hypothetical protein|nr:hypothetical protein [Kofleriaceae bacterium]